MHLRQWVADRGGRIRVGKAKDVESTDPEMACAMFSIAEAWGLEGSDR